MSQKKKLCATMKNCLTVLYDNSMWQCTQQQEMAKIVSNLIHGPNWKRKSVFVPKAPHRPPHPLPPTHTDTHAYSRKKQRVKLTPRDHRESSQSSWWLWACLHYLFFPVAAATAVPHSWLLFWGSGSRQICWISWQWGWCKLVGRRWEALW